MAGYVSIGTSETAIHFMIYEQIKKLLKGGRDEIALVDCMLAAGLAKFTASSMCYPHGKHASQPAFGTGIV